MFQVDQDAQLREDDPLDDCVFCHIVAGRAPASFVHRDDLVSAFLGIRPVTPSQLLVIPNEHVVFTHELPDDTGRTGLRGRPTPGAHPAFDR